MLPSSSAASRPPAASAECSPAVSLPPSVAWPASVKPLTPTQRAVVLEGLYDAATPHKIAETAGISRRSLAWALQHDAELLAERSFVEAFHAATVRAELLAIGCGRAEGRGRTAALQATLRVLQRPPGRAGRRRSSTSATETPATELTGAATPATPSRSPAQPAAAIFDDATNRSLLERVCELPRLHEPPSAAKAIEELEHAAELEQARRQEDATAVDGVVADRSAAGRSAAGRSSHGDPFREAAACREARDAELLAEMNSSAAANRPLSREAVGRVFNRLVEAAEERRAAPSTRRSHDEGDTNEGARHETSGERPSADDAPLVATESHTADSSQAARDSATTPVRSSRSSRSR